MIKRPALCFLAVVATCVFMSLNMASGWHAAGSEPAAYEMGIASEAGRNGGNAATIRSIKSDVSGFGTLMQSAKPTQFLGKRVRMTGYVKTEKVVESAGLWMRVDRAQELSNAEVSVTSPSFDNMYNRSIKGTTGWTKYEIVLDVPADATMLAYGALLSGSGQVWFDDISFETVNSPVAVTQRPGYVSQAYNMDSEKYKKMNVLSAPSNLGFDNK